MTTPSYVSSAYGVSSLGLFSTAITIMGVGGGLGDGGDGGCGVGGGACGCGGGEGLGGGEHIRLSPQVIGQLSAAPKKLHPVPEKAAATSGHSVGSLDAAQGSAGGGDLGNAGWIGGGGEVGLSAGTACIRTSACFVSTMPCRKHSS